MKPLYLELSAFGSFSGTETIRFDALGQDGVYLITGDTGAGKTTIFDAISFALYGEASGGRQRRESRNFRSDYADPGTDTYVILRFEQHGKQYKIHRSPQYERPAKRGGKGKLVKHSASAYLEDLQTDALLADGAGEVSKYVEQIIGLNQKQFAQTVMIAQGEFQKIISAKSDDRKGIFQKLFHTRIYDLFQNRLKERMDECTKQKEKLDENVRTAMQQGIFEKDFLPETDGQQPVLPTKYVRLLTEQNAVSASELERLTLQQAAYSESIQTLTAQIAKGKEQNALLDDLQKQQAELCILLAQEPQMQQMQQTIARAKEAERIRIPETRLLDRRRDLQRQADAVKQTGTELECCKQQYEQTMAEWERQQSMQPETERKKADMLKIEQYLPKYRLLAEKQTEYDAACMQLQQHQEKSNAAAAAYQETLNAFLLGQAGVLARTLTKDTPCPVCGSLHHPSPAAESEHTPSQADLQNAEQQRSKAMTDFQKQSEHCNALYTEIQTIRADAFLQTVTQEEAERQHTAWSEQIRCAEQALQTAQEHYDTANTAYTRLSGAYETQQAELEHLHEAVRQCEILFRKALQDSPFTDEAEYHSAKQEPASLKQMEQEHSRYCKTRSELQAVTENLQKRTKGVERMDIRKLQARMDADKEQFRNVEQQIHTLKLHHDRNVQVLKTLKQCLQKLEPVRKQEAVLSELYRVVSGQKGGGTAKLRLEAYVQRYYFHRVVHCANQRLSKLTEDTFKLRCRETAVNLNQQSGLDLEVLDRNTGSWRDISTLSGGESFLASLSLSLGLSDVVQEESGGIALDSMFIDEGFGTLDDTALHQAVGLLTQLADGKRMIGIISHVSELKQSIDRKIIVSKDFQGSHVTLVTE